MQTEDVTRLKRAQSQLVLTDYRAITGAGTGVRQSEVRSPEGVETVLRHDGAEDATAEAAAAEAEEKAVAEARQAEVADRVSRVVADEAARKAERDRRYAARKARKS